MDKQRHKNSGHFTVSSYNTRSFPTRRNNRRGNRVPKKGKGIKNNYVPRFPENPNHRPQYQRNLNQTNNKKRESNFFNFEQIHTRSFYFDLRSNC